MNINDKRIRAKLKLGVAVGRQQSGDKQKDALALDQIKGMISGLRSENVHGLVVMALTKDTNSPDSLIAGHTMMIGSPELQAAMVDAIAIEIEERNEQAADECDCVMCSLRRDIEQTFRPGNKPSLSDLTELLRGLEKLEQAIGDVGQKLPAVIE